MNRYALVQSGLVVNVVLWDGQSPWSNPLTSVLLTPDSPVCPGYSYDGVNFTAPPSLPPPIVV
ncbi:hypothetical protein [Burkholderia sp. RS02]|uniref:hypothetical protein n=1 Tax=unclassified Burkholderia TaxID=2613784 RepID=UPI0032181216